MKLTEAVESLGSPEVHRDWKVAILTRPSDEKTGERSAVVKHPVFDVHVDDEGTEINLLTGEEASSRRGFDAGMSVGELWARLNDLLPKCEDYSMYSGSENIELDEECAVRIDVPLVGVGLDPQGGVFGFLQWPLEQWQ